MKLRHFYELQNRYEKCSSEKTLPYRHCKNFEVAFDIAMNGPNLGNV